MTTVSPSYIMWKGWHHFFSISASKGMIEIDHIQFRHTKLLQPALVSELADQGLTTFKSQPASKSVVCTPGAVFSWLQVLWHDGFSELGSDRKLQGRKHSTSNVMRHYNKPDTFPQRRSRSFQSLFRLISPDMLTTYSRMHAFILTSPLKSFQLEPSKHLS